MRLLFICFVSIFIAACSSLPEELISASNTIGPQTVTVLPSDTPTSTSTPTITPTATPSSSPTTTPSPTLIPTSTPVLPVFLYTPIPKSAGVIASNNVDQIIELAKWDSVTYGLFSPDGNMMVTATQEEIQLRSAIDGKVLQSFTICKNCYSYKFALSADGNYLAAIVVQKLGGSSDSRLASLMLWRTSDGKLLYKLYENQDRPVMDFVFSPAGDLIAATNNYAYLFVWRLSDGRRILAIQRGGRGLSFSPDGQSIVSSFGSIALSDKSVLLESFSDPEEAKHPIEGRLSPDGKIIAFGTEGRKYWGTSDSPCGTAPCYIDDKRGLIGLYKTSDGQQLRVLEGHTGDIVSLAFAPDNTLLVSTSRDGTLRLWKVSDGSLLRTITIDGVYSVDISSDGRQIVVSTLSGLSIWGVRP